MNEPDIIVIINSFNRVSLLKECIRSLVSWIPSSVLNNRISIVVYDAGSTDGSLEWLEESKNQMHISLNIIVASPGEDNSFAAGLNAGVQHAYTLFPNLKYLLFYETDNQILNDTPVLQALLELDARTNLAACGFTVSLHNGKPAGAGMPFPKLLNFLLGKNLVHKFQLESIPYRWESSICNTQFSKVDVVFTSPLIVKTEAWSQSEGLDAKTFPFSDCDVDWARRLNKLGWYMGVTRTNTVIHDNIGALSSWSKNRAVQFHNARLKYFRRYHPASTYIIWPALLIVRHFCELLLVNLLEKDISKRKQLNTQFFDLLKRCHCSYR